MRRVMAEKTNFFLEVVYNLLPVTYRQLSRISRDYALSTVLDGTDFGFIALAVNILTHINGNRQSGKEI